MKLELAAHRGQAYRGSECQGVGRTNQLVALFDVSLIGGPWLRC